MLQIGLAALIVVLLAWFARGGKGAASGKRGCLVAVLAVPALFLASLLVYIGLNPSPQSKPYPEHECLAAGGGEYYRTLHRQWSSVKPSQLVAVHILVELQDSADKIRAKLISASRDLECERGLDVGPGVSSVQIFAYLSELDAVGAPSIAWVGHLRWDRATPIVEINAKRLAYERSKQGGGVKAK